MRNVLRRQDFRRLFAGLFFSMTSESVLLLALAIWVKDLTGSDGMAGAAILAVVAPMVFAPLIGFVVDRFRRKPFLVTVLLMSVVLLVPLLLINGRDDVWILYAVAMGYGLSMISVSAALNGLIKEVMPEELLSEANGALQTVKQGLRLVAPLAGAGLYAATKGWGLAVAGMIGFLLAALIISSLRVREEMPPRSEMHWVAEVGAGVKHLFTTPGLRRALIGVSAAIIVFGFGEPVFFALVDQGLHREPTFLAVLVCLQGVGGLLGGLTAARLVRRVGELGALGIGVALLIPMLVTSLTPRVWLALPCMVLGGFGLPYAIVGLMTLLQRETPQEMMGRVSAAMDALISAPQALAIAFGALLVELIDFRVLFAAMAALAVVAATYLWLGRHLSLPSERVEPVQDEPVRDGAAVGQPESV
ncbi:MFS transporter [Rhizocola hellebori]|uniref:MFS transporter n=1 Tax=Rhizocola hellebori TaxID=1392758 RepID=A0A8J3QIZ6_9ACTN|nr:MFS transporter [Rhizocola hellebori]GIH11778.1 MFS transporter [Rhizocola hellebori]